MKHFLIFIIFVSMCVSTYGQETYTGKLICSGNPCPPSEEDCLPSVTLWLETTSMNYVLTINSGWIWDCSGVTVDGVKYLRGYEVEITGKVSSWIDIHSEEVFELEIETIKTIHGPDTYTGKIICVESLYRKDVWLETASMNYQLTTNHGLMPVGCPLIFEGVEYLDGDEVEITGTVSVWKGLPPTSYVIEIEAIKKTNDGVSYVPSFAFTVYSQDNGIVVQNVPEGESIAVYNPSGELIVTAVAGENETYIPLPAKGVYMVKVAGVAMKVVL